jgi:hypothetical protein
LTGHLALPGFNEILTEIAQTPNNPALGSSFDQVRRKYLGTLAAHTQRHTILYATRWLQGVPPGAENLIAITDEDLQGLMSTVQGHTGSALDLILHSPGGSAEAAESIVHYLRDKFTNIRVIVPHLAMSAATMISCAANRVVMGRHSSLGPTDPQLFLQTPLGARGVPAQAILEQFEMAREQCKDPAGLRAWAPILPQYGPDLLVTCENASQLTRRLVNDWLRRYMLAHVTSKAARGKRVRKLAKFLTDHKFHRTHGRHLDRELLRDHGMEIDNLERDPVEQDLVLSVYHATTLCFSSLPGVVKLIENHSGRLFAKMVTMATPTMFLPMAPAPGAPPRTPGGAPPQAPAQPAPGNP